MSDTRRNLIVAAITLALSIGYLVWASSYPPANAAAPKLIAWVAIVLTSLDVLAHTDTALGRRTAQLLSGRAHLTAESGARFTGTEWLAAGWTAVSLAAVVLGGFIVGLALYILGYMIIHARLSWRLSLGVSAGTVVACWLLFDEVLKVGLYRGMFFED
jgi:hypothetical protein